MTLDGQQLERIVREVLRQVLTRDVAAAQGAPAAPPAVLPESTAELALSERVITMERLRGRLQGVRRLHVDARAIVTPLVRDELRARAIELVRGSNENKQATGTTQLTVGWYAANPAGSSRPPLIAGVNWQVWSRWQDGLPSGDAAGATPPAIIVTPDWAAATCAANRHPSICAATVSSLPAFDQAVAQVCPNWFIIPAGHGMTPASGDLVQRIAAWIVTQPQRETTGATRS